MADVRGVQRAFEQLGQVAEAQPGAHHPAVVRFRERRADAHADGFDAIAVKVEGGHVFAVGLGQTVVTVRAARGVGIDHFVLPVEADHMVGTGEDHPLHPVAARGFVDVEHAADVGAEDLFERALGRHAAEVQDRVHAFDQLMHRLLVGQIAGHDFFAIIDGRCDIGDVRQANHIGVRAQAFAQDFPEATGGAGQQQAIERGAGGCSGRHGNPGRLVIIFRFVVGCRTTVAKYR
ncbi:hypothetical protein D3C85_941350 [compost metagenome]